jgi:hypothetical protein
VKRTNRFLNPVVKRWIALAIIVAGGLFAAAGAVVRATAAGSDAQSSSYLLDVAGWLTVVAGAVLEARAAQLFLQAFPRSAKRRAISFTTFGLPAALIGCVLASTVADSDAPALVAGAAMFVLLAGAGIGLAGLFSLGWFYGGDYAASRIERMGDDDW